VVLSFQARPAGHAGARRTARFPTNFPHGAFERQLTPGPFESIRLIVAFRAKRPRRGLPVARSLSAGAVTR